MIHKIKTAVQDRLYEKCIKEYEDALQCQTDPYLLWIRETEQLMQIEGKEESYPSLLVVYMEQCKEKFRLEELNKDIILFVSGNGKIAVHAFGEIMQYFERHKEVDIVYADEDVWMLPEGETDEDPDNELTHRICPWLKPMWSPDTLFSFQYFGHIFAVRRKAFLDTKWLGLDDDKMNLYDFLLQATERGKRAGHIEKILFHAYYKGKDRAQIEQEVMHQRELWGASDEYDFIRELALDRRGIKGKMLPDKESGYSYPLYQIKGQPLVSIIIPSKDNVEVLKQCIRSLYRYTQYKQFEIIVIDNGSTAQGRMTLEGFKEECAFTYLYQPMEFNFSKMCNLGAKLAKGEYLLLLNDDMEVLADHGDWLTRMIGQASLKHVGAVGAKLLYPDSKLIQHAGVTNTVAGPGHKLKQFEDTQSYYYGRNKLIYDMIGVTAACMLLRRDRFLALGGLYEGLKVAYNDVDLCFRLCRKGLYNVQRNDVVLYHHESLSRGDDLQDEVKLKRLLAEKEVLYQRHPGFLRKDPFIGTLLNSGEAAYTCRWIEGYEFADITGYRDEVRKGKKLPDAKRMNQAIMIVVEDCERERPAGNGKKAHYLVKGWAYIPGADNAKYRLKLLLKNEQNEVWEVMIKRRYRKDVAAILPDETNVEMTGFCCWIEEGALPQGTYELWLTAKDRCSRQRLYRNTQKSLEIQAP